LGLFTFRNDEDRELFREKSLLMNRCVPTGRAIKPAAAEQDLQNTPLALSDLGHQA